MKRMNRLFAAAISAALLAGCSAGTSDAGITESGDTVYKIGVSQIVEHPSLNTIREAMMDEFAKEGYVEGENLIVEYEHAAGQPANLETIMSGFAADDVNAIVAIATPTAQAAQKYSAQIPVIFSAVSDPVGAGLVESNEAPGGNITGTSDEVQVDQIIDLMTEINPDAKTVGALYNAGEANSVSNVKRFKEYAESKGLTVVEKTGTDLTTMQQAAQELTETCDVMFSPNDNTVANAMVQLGKIAEDAGVPYYVGADSMVETGGFATVGINYEDLGRETAKMTIDVLNGTSPSEMPVKVFKDNLYIYVNQDLLDKFSASSKTPTLLPEDLKGQDNLKMVVVSQ